MEGCTLSAVTETETSAPRVWRS